MSKYGVPRVNVTFKDINKIEEGYRIYKDTTSFDETTLPTPLVDISAEDVANFKKYNYFDDDVLEGNTYFYRVGAYGGGEEILSDEKQVVADKTPERFLYTNEAKKIQKYDANLDLLWETTQTSRIANDIFVDINGYTYFVTDSYNPSEVQKIDANGNMVWTIEKYLDRTKKIFVDIKGYVYVTSYDNTVKKFDPDGNEVWGFSGHTGIVWGLFVDKHGYVYSGSTDTTVRKISPDGNEVWSYAGHGDVVYSIAVDSSGNVYSGGYGGVVKKTDTDGNELWSYNDANQIHGIVIDYDGNVIISGYDYKVMKISSGGVLLWVYTSTHQYLSDLALDADGYIYVATSTTVVIQLDGNGEEVAILNIGATTISKVEVYPGPLHVSHGLTF